MLFSLQRIADGAGILQRTAATDIVVQCGTWTVAIDAMVSHQRRGEVEGAARRLVDTLAQQGAAGLDQAGYEALFGGHFAVIAFDAATGRGFALRDVAGAKTLYMAQDAERLLLGTVLNEVVTALGRSDLSHHAVSAWMVLDYMPDRTTLYSGVEELGMGHVLAFDRPGGLQPPQRHFGLDLAGQENDFDQPTNVGLLRDGILAAHARRAGSDNVVMLSGGIDSSIMLCALREIVEPSRLRAVSFRVKGTSQDETVYAERLAKALSVPIEIREVDPQDPAIFADFEADLLAMNRPYMGKFIYGELDGTPDSVFFAGQDTRLHTPDMNGLDQLAFAMLPLQRNGVTRGAAAALAAGLGRVLRPGGAYAAAPRWRRGLYRAALALDPDSYLQKFVFHIDAARWREQGISDAQARQLAASVGIRSRDARNGRQLYNMIVAERWHTQYTDDMRYLQDMGRMRGTHVALPFYDIALARLSSQLPMDQTTRYMRGQSKFDRTRQARVNKVLLRETFRKELPEELLLRAKAVSNTQHLLYTGIAGQKIRAILARDAALGTGSVVRRLGLEGYVNRFMAMTAFAESDEAFLARIFSIAAVALAGARREIG